MADKRFINLLDRVSPGQPWLPPSADAQNAMLEAGLDLRLREKSSTRIVTTPEIDPTDTCYLENTSGSDLNEYAIVGLGEPVWTAADNLKEFQQVRGFKGVSPTADHTGKFAICLEPIPINRIGIAAIGGTIPCKVQVQNNADVFADVEAGSTAHLKSGSTGSAQILWHAPGTFPSEVWAIVRLGPTVSAPSAVLPKLGFWFQLPGLQSLSGTPLNIEWNTNSPSIHQTFGGRLSYDSINREFVANAQMDLLTHVQGHFDFGTSAGSDIYRKAGIWMERRNPDGTTWAKLSQARSFGLVANTPFIANDLGPVDSIDFIGNATPPSSAVTLLRLTATENRMRVRAACNPNATVTAYAVNLTMLEVSI